MIGHEPMTVEAVVTHCANPKCRMGREKGVPATPDHHGISGKADLWPVTTLADGGKVLKFCGISCCHDYQKDQAKMPENQRDPDIGTILCTRCGGEIEHGNNGLQGVRDRLCSVKCVPQLALVYQARHHAASKLTNRSLDARRRDDLPAPEDGVDMKASYEQRRHASSMAGKGALWPLLMPDLDTIYEWRVELDCGCVHQAFTGGSDSKNPETLLAASEGYVFLDGSLKLPPGQRVCFCDSRRPLHGPVRDIIEWVDRDSKVIDPEPITIDGRERLTAEPFVSWYVVLDCGHVETVSTDPAWTPSEGFVPRGYKRPRRELERSFREIHADEEHYLAYSLRLLDEKWPEPAPFTNCNACRHSYFIVAYQAVGLVSPPPKPPRKPRAQKSREQILREQVKRTERELARLRKELKAEQGE